MTSDPWAELERLVHVMPEPIDQLRTNARRVLLQATKAAPSSTGLSVAIDEFHAELEYMLLCLELSSRDCVDLNASRTSCLECLRAIKAICRHHLN